MDPDNNYTVYTCPMHLDVRHTEPGVCIKCGRALEPDTEDDDAQLVPKFSIPVK